MSSASFLTPNRCVGVVGLGLVGTALAKRLQMAGYECIGFDVRQEAMAGFESLGFQTSSSVVQMLDKTNVLVLAVFDTTGVLDVVAQIKQHRHLHVAEDQPTLTLIDCSTGDPVQLAELAKQLSLFNIHLIEAPLSGSSVQIQNGEATLLLGGEASHIDSVADVLSALANSKVHVGGAGMAAKAKLATNLVLGLNRAALAEGIVFAQTLGIQPDAFLQLVLSTPARSEAAVVKGDMMVKEEFAPQSRIRQHLKDVQLMLDMAQASTQSLPLSQAHAQLMRNAIAEGDGELDNAAIIRQIRREKTTRIPPN
ncbi:MAG: NAD(P)-dependent oxidoreductase [Betaproteobacteria bacterium]|nr:NAD(P)-dependent oxidoreductase [Betaproteobacteria bacterium]